jgi:hypothetical protein
MNSLWNNLYDRHKDRRYATIFLTAILAFFGMAVIGVVLYLNAPAFDVPLIDLTPGFSILVAALIWVGVRRSRRPGKTPPRFSPLSRDEKHKARSKLLKDQQFRKL